MLDLGSIHGRFQPFHNGHLAYALEALERCDRLYVGLTKVLTEQGIGGEVSAHRLEEKSNPLNYFQRSEVIMAALEGAGVARARIIVGPFPIEVPERLEEFWPACLPCFTTIKDEWNVRKIQELKGLGYAVEVLTLPRGISYESGSAIREKMRIGDTSWKNSVPEAAWALLDGYIGQGII